MKITLFSEMNTSADEYTHLATVWFIGGYCLIGCFAKYGQYAVVLLNRAFGLWFEGIEK